MDYFLARYYSAIQGRFTSPDEFTGGPDELYYFADDASANPTFYAELRNPHSLNKYQYSYNNPLRYVDPDGHEPDQNPKCSPCKGPTDQEIIEGVQSVLDTVADVTGITALADWLRAEVPAAVKRIAGSQKCMDPGTCGQQILLEKQTNAQAKSQSQTQGSIEKDGGGGYINVPDPKNAGPGKKFTPNQRKQILEANKAKNEGELRSDKSGQRLNPPTQTRAGQRRDPNEAQVDHIRARSKGGTNRSRNAQVLSGRENRKKGAKDQ